MKIIGKEHFNNILRFIDTELDGYNDKVKIYYLKRLIDHYQLYSVCREMEAVVNEIKNG